MKAMNELRKRKAISPVIATVILVAVAITIAVAVAYWMAGIAGQYTSFEKVEIQTGYATKNTAASTWTITLILKNSGTSTSTLINCFINEGLATVPVTGDGTSGAIGTGLAGITVESGKSVTVTIGPIPFAFSSSGTTLNIKLHSASGMDYIRLIQLP